MSTKNPAFGTQIDENGNETGTILLSSDFTIPTAGVDPTGKYILVGDQSGNDSNVMIFNTVDLTFNSNLNYVFTSVAGIVFDAFGNIYVNAPSDGGILSFKSITDNDPGEFTTNFKTLWNIALDPEGYVYGTDISSGYAYKISPEQQIPLVTYVLPNDFQSNFGIAIDSESCVYVNDMYSNQVYKFANEGPILYTINGDSGFDTYYLSISKTDDIYFIHYSGYVTKSKVIATQEVSGLFIRADTGIFTSINVSSVSGSNGKQIIGPAGQIYINQSTPVSSYTGIVQIGIGIQTYQVSFSGLVQPPAGTSVYMIVNSTGLNYPGSVDSSGIFSANDQGLNFYGTDTGLVGMTVILEYHEQSGIISQYSNVIIDSAENANFANVTAYNSIVAPFFIGDGSLLTNVGSSSTFTQPLANLVVSNTVTTTNVAVSGSINCTGTTTTTNLIVIGAISSNVTNTTLFYDTMSVPYIYALTANVATLNVSSLENISGSLNVSGTSNLATMYAATSNIGTLNVSSIENISGSLNVSGTSNLATLYAATSNIGTLNVSSIENVSNLRTILANVTSLNVSSIENVSNLVSTLANVITANISGLTVGPVTANPVLTVNGNSFFSSDTLVTPFGTFATINTLTGMSVGAPSPTLGSNLAVFSNTSGATTVITGNAIGISNLSPATTLSVGGTISALGNATTFGTVAPMTWRQGNSGTTWNPAGGAQSNYYLGTSAVQMQCGSNTMAVNPQTITFPSPYVNNPIVLVTSYSQASSNLWVSSISSTQFQLTANAIGTFEWISFGI